MIRVTALFPPVAGRRRQAGFTLMELIVALAVISVAATVYFSFYASSLMIGRTAKNRTVAMQLAEAQLHVIQRHPDRFLWQTPETPDNGRFPVLLAENDPPAGNPVSPPAILPVEERARRREEALYDRFRWKAWGRIPAPECGFYELTVVISWEEAQREEIIALTSTVPGGFLPGPVMPAPPVEEAAAAEEKTAVPDGEPAANSEEAQS
jgi:prepilin-type N-terminal cleavage/methylation domain-containing protein